MTENLTGVQVQYLTPSEFADAVRLAISDDGKTQQAVAEIIGLKRTDLASAISHAKNGREFRFTTLAKAYVAVVDCYDVGLNPNGNVFVVFGEIETGHKTDDSPLVPFKTADGGTVGISQNIIDKLGL